ncbi:hypothetical protein N9N67_00580 [Bacteriovoracaceae bacterium]|nr:hypothetical protein [Bacteriovoracaceae bacterium]
MSFLINNYYKNLFTTFFFTIISLGLLSCSKVEQNPNQDYVDKKDKEKIGKKDSAKRNIRDQIIPIEQVSNALNQIFDQIDYAIKISFDENTSFRTVKKGKKIKTQALIEKLYYKLQLSPEGNFSIEDNQEYESSLIKGNINNLNQIETLTYDIQNKQDTYRVLTIKNQKSKIEIFNIIKYLLSIKDRSNYNFTISEDISAEVNETAKSIQIKSTKPNVTLLRSDEGIYYDEIKIDTLDLTYNEKTGLKFNKDYIMTYVSFEDFMFHNIINISPEKITLHRSTFRGDKWVPSVDGEVMFKNEFKK